MLEQTQKLKVIFTKTQNDIIDSIIEDIKKAGDNYNGSKDRCSKM